MMSLCSLKIIKRFSEAILAVPIPEFLANHLQKVLYNLWSLTTKPEEDIEIETFGMFLCH